MTKSRVILIGGGGHARVLLDAMNLLSYRVIGYTDKQPTLNLDLDYIGNDQDIFKYFPESVKLVNAIGSVNVSYKRKEIYNYFKERGYSFATVIHPSAIIGSNVILGEGTQIMAGTIIQSGTILGENCIVNTKVSIDHDCMIGNHVHIAPGVTVSGDVVIGEGTFIGTGTNIIQGIQIGARCLVGAGSLLIKSIEDDQKVYGVPAKEAK